MSRPSTWLEGAADVELGDAAGAAARGFLLLAQDKRGPVETFGQFACHQADDAVLEVGAACHQQRRIVCQLGGQLLLGLGLDLVGQRAPLLVEVFQRLGVDECRGRVGRAQQVVGQLGVLEPAGGVEAWGQAEGNGGAVHAARR